VILGMAVLAQALTAFALEVERGCIEKDQTELAEQVVAQGEQLLLDEILGGAGTKAVPALVGERVAEPAHRAVKLVKLKTGDTVDHQAPAPLLGGAVGAGIEQAMEDGEKDGAFEIELEVALGGERADHLLAAGLPP